MRAWRVHRPGRPSLALQRDEIRLAASEWVLVHAAAGGVGSAAVQLAVAAGARVIATATAILQTTASGLGIALAVVPFAPLLTAVIFNPPRHRPAAAADLQRRGRRPAPSACSSAR
jgi:NADPH:quinone reductase-like Zn-dependent oxidoreductase